LLVFLKSALEPETRNPSITGSQKCGECHSLKNLGDQYTVWFNSKHSNAYKSLLNQIAIDYNKNNGLKLPVNEEKCLKCHTTKYSLNSENVGLYYNISEGVGCETCHGAGSLYSPSEIMKDSSLFIKFGGLIPNKNTCIKCHSEKINNSNVFDDNICPFQNDVFDYNSAIEKIKHPINTEQMK
jgi:hypothetical protein